MLEAHILRRKAIRLECDTVPESVSDKTNITTMLNIM